MVIIMIQNAVIIIIMMIINFRHSFHLLISPYVKLGLYIQMRIHAKKEEIMHTFDVVLTVHLR